MGSGNRVPASTEHEGRRKDPQSAFFLGHETQGKDTITPRKTPARNGGTENNRGKTPGNAGYRRGYGQKDRGGEMKLRKVQILVQGGEKSFPRSCVFRGEAGNELKRQGRESSCRRKSPTGGEARIFN